MKRLIFFLVCTVLFSCKQLSQIGQEPDSSNNGNGSTQKSSITFFNESSYTVNIYKNYNPDFYDETNLLLTVPPGGIKKIQEPASVDKLTGDVFYIKYNVLLADAITTGSNDIYVQAEQSMANISFVVEEGKSYTKTIINPGKENLKINSSYIQIQNQTLNSIYVTKGGSSVYEMGTDTLLLEPNKTGWYEITVPYGEESYFSDLYSIVQDGSQIKIPQWEIKRGYLTKFVFNSSGITIRETTKITF